MIEPAQSDGGMSNREQAPRPGEDYAREVAEPARLAVPRSSARRRRDAWLLLFVLLVGTITIVALSGGNTQRPPQARGAQPGRASLPPSQTQPGAPTTTTAPGTFREYPLPQSNDGLMRLTIDHEGRPWFGEMGRNYLAVPRASLVVNGEPHQAIV